MFLSGVVLELVRIYMRYLHNNFFHPGSNVLPQCSKPDRFTSVLPVGLLLLL